MSQIQQFYTPQVMGILNTTPDSFYAESRVTPDTILAQAEKMLHEGAQILDIGGMSTRPGAAEVSETEELNRTINTVLSLKKAFPAAILSIDTYRSRVAHEAVSAGASLVNDVSGGRHDPLLFGTVAALGTPYILMHSIGTSANMQDNPKYNDVTKLVFDFFYFKIKELNTLGINDIILDVGFGFGKTIAHNYELLQNLNQFAALGCPILVGVSRKSMIYKHLGITPQAALPATSALHLYALQQGAHILRTHDVAEAVQTIALHDILKIKTSLY